MNFESLECENLDANELSDTKPHRVAGEHHDPGVFAWMMVGALGALLGATTVVILLF